MTGLSLPVNFAYKLISSVNERKLFLFTPIFLRAVRCYFNSGRLIPLPSKWAIFKRICCRQHNAEGDG